jgi:hypothetical protein
LKRLFLLVLGLLWAVPANAYLVQANLAGSGTTGLINHLGFSVQVTYETTTNTVTKVSLNIAEPVGNPSTSIIGPLGIDSSSIVVTNTASVDEYLFTISILNGPFVYATQLPNNLVRTAQLTQIRLNSAQNSNPLSSDALDENQFAAFIPGSGTQPQRLFLEFIGIAPFEYNVPETIGVYSPTSVGVVNAASPAPLALLAGGALALGIGAVRRRA